ncbi:MAG: MFS transporter [Candidatus Hodarchaeota archaeon]
MTSLNRIVNQYYLFTFIRGLAFFMPIWALYLYSHGFDIFMITAMDVAFWLSMALAEIPTGTIADKVSRKVSILFGIFLVSVGITVFGLANNLWIVLCAYVIWAIGITFWSGADQAFLYDTLKSYGKEGDFQRIYGQVIFFSGLAMALSSAIGGILAIYDLRLPILLTAGTTLAAGALMLLIPEKRPPDSLTQDRYSQHVVDTVRLVARNPTVLLIFAFAVIFTAVGIIEAVFRQIYLEADLGIEVFFIGLIYSILILLSSLGGKVSFRLSDLVGEKLFLWLQAVVIALVLFSLSLAIPWLSITSILIYAFLRSTFNPFSTRIVNEEIPSEKRATVFSLLGVLITSTILFAELAAGYLANTTSIAYTYFIIMGIFLGVSFVPLILWTKIMPEKAVFIGEDRQILPS